MTQARQIPFDLGHRTAMGREDFLIAPSNQDAVAWIDLWPEWPAPVLVLYGPVSSGKSHLAAVWAARSNASRVAAGEVSDRNADELARRGGHLVIDDADRLIGDVAGEKGLFHLYNMFREERRTILLTMVDAPVRRSFTLPDLASRLRAAPCVAIREPDEALLAAILVKLFNDRQLRVGAGVVNYIMPRIERSFEAVHSLVARIDRENMVSHSPVSIRMVRDMLEG